MNPEEFRKLWEEVSEEELVCLPKGIASNLGLNTETLQFLTSSGLPNSAAPFLSFDLVDLRPLNSDVYYPDLPNEFNFFLNLGADGEGNPITLNSNDCCVYWHDHENSFEPSKMNSSVAFLGRCLLQYERFINRIIEEYGENGFLNGSYTRADVLDMKRSISIMDSQCFIPGAFWFYEIETLFVNINTSPTS